MIMHNASTGYPEKLLRRCPRQSLINYCFLTFLFLAMLLPWEDVYRFFFFAGVLPLTIWSFFKDGKPAAAGSPIVIMLVLLTAYLALNSFFVSESEFRAIFRRFRWGVTVIVLIGSLLIVSNQWIKKPRTHGRFFLVAVVVSGLVMLVPYLQLGDFSVRIAGVGILWHTIQASSILLVLWMLGFILLLLSPDKLFGDKLLALLSLCMVLIVIFLSQSRGPLLAAGVSVFPMIVLLMILLPRRRRFIAFGVFGALIVSIGFFLRSRQDMFAWYGDVLTSRGFSFRPEIWKSVIDQSSSGWLFGVGSATRFPDSAAGKALFEKTGVSIAHTHNLLLEVFYAGGIIALLLLLFAIAFLFYKLLVMTVASRVKTACLCLLAVILGVNFTDTVSPLSSPGPDWVLLWLPLIFLVVISTIFTEKKEKGPASP